MAKDKIEKQQEVIISFFIILFPYKTTMYKHHNYD